MFNARAFVPFIKNTAISKSGLNDEDEIVDYSSRDLAEGQIVKYTD